MTLGEKGGQEFIPADRPEEGWNKGWTEIKKKMGQTMADFNSGNLPLNSFTFDMKKHLTDLERGSTGEIKGNKKE